MHTPPSWIFSSLVRSRSRDGPSYSLEYPGRNECSTRSFYRFILRDSPKTIAKYVRGKNEIGRHPLIDSVNNDIPLKFSARTKGTGDFYEDWEQLIGCWVRSTLSPRCRRSDDDLPDRCALVWQDFFSIVAGERNGTKGRERRDRGKEERGLSSPVGRAAIPSLFRERVRDPPNQFQLESGIFAGQAQHSPWKGLLAVLSYYRELRCGELRVSLAVNQAPAHTESTVLRRDPCVALCVDRPRMCVDVCADRSSTCARVRGSPLPNVRTWNGKREATKRERRTKRSVDIRCVRERERDRTSAGGSEIGD